LCANKQYDVLSGRGGGVNGHPGNKRYRALVNSAKDEYLSPRTKKLDKAHIALRIVKEVRESVPPGRFLKKDPRSGLWHEIGDAAAVRKTGQALRENSSEYRLSYWSNWFPAKDAGTYVGLRTTRTSEV